MSNILKVALILAALLVVLYVVYVKFIKVKPIAEVFGPGLPIQVAEKPLDVNMCAWLNRTYPEMRLNKFDTVDGGANNPDGVAQWKLNKCSLIY